VALLFDKALHNHEKTERYQISEFSLKEMGWPLNAAEAEP